MKTQIIPSTWKVRSRNMKMAIHLITRTITRNKMIVSTMIRKSNWTTLLSLTCTIPNKCSSIPCFTRSTTLLRTSRKHSPNCKARTKSS